MLLKKLMLLWWVAAFALSGALPAAAQGQPFDLQAVLAYAETVMKDYRVPGIGIAIVQNGETVYTGGLGVRNTVEKTPVTADSGFQIGSISKSFTALAVMVLVQAGKIDLDAPVITYLPDFRLATEESTKALTVRHLLTHTSGLPRADDRWYASALSTRAEIVADMVNIQPTAKPGEVYQYCNQNYVLAGHLVEVISGQRFEDFVAERILAPLGMKGATFDLATQAAPTAPHSVLVIEGPRPIPPFARMALIAATGGIVASPNDMAAYINYQLGDGSPLLQPALFAETHTPAIGMGQEASFPDQKYAFGWVRYTHNGTDIITHDGSIDGYYANVTLFPEINSGFAILANEQGLAPAAITTLAHYTTEALLGKDHDPAFAERVAKEVNLREYQRAVAKAATYDASKDDFAPLVGRYTTVLGSIAIEMRGSEVWAVFTDLGGVEVQLIPFDKYTFLPNGTSSPTMIVSFALNPPGYVTMTANGYQIGQRQIATPTPSK